MAASIESVRRRAPEDVTTDDDPHTYILVTGCNAGIGYAICTRTIDEFLASRPSSQILHLIITTRSRRKNDDTIKRLRSHVLHIAASGPKSPTSPTSSIPSDPSEGSYPSTQMPDGRSRVQFSAHDVDLCVLPSIRRAGNVILAAYPRIDAMICNAGMLGSLGVRWPLMFWRLATDFKASMTSVDNTFLSLGAVVRRLDGTERSKPSTKDSTSSTNDSTNGPSKPSENGSREKRSSSIDDEPPLGEVFCANTFGHYLLAAQLMPLLRRSNAHQAPGRLIWISTIDSDPYALDLHDIQALRHERAYASTKRLTEIMILTSDLPRTQPWARSFYRDLPPQSPIQSASTSQPKAPSTVTSSFETTNAKTRQNHDPPLETNQTPDADDPLAPASIHSADGSIRPRTFISHPGSCMTGVVPLPWIMAQAQFLAFLLARLIGTVWVNVFPRAGANATVWLALAPLSTIEAAETRDGPGKWGSASGPLGREMVLRTEVPGWGWGGGRGTVSGSQRTVPGGRGTMSGGFEAENHKWHNTPGRPPTARDTTDAQRREFARAGEVVWREMEALRAEWTARVDRLETRL